MAGVASTAKGVGIHRINDKKKYQEWEFIYDIKNDKTTGVGQMMQQQQNMQQNNQTGVTNGGSGIGSQPGQGIGTQQPGTGSTPTPPSSQPQQPPPNQ